MPKNISELKHMWEKEKKEYETQEVGSGVQKFVKAVLNASDIFNLGEGKLSTSVSKRWHEFLEEKSRKTKRPDVTIYIDSQIIIPVEVEKYQNIKAGKQQLFDYQRVWEKKYGLLTDGYEWQFFNNTLLVRKFTIYDIFNKPGEFLEFWKEYIQPQNYYLQFFEKIGQLEFFEEDLSVDRKRENFFEDVTTLIKSFNNKLNIKGYFKEFTERESKKKAVEITYAYLIQFILYKTLVDNDFEHFAEDFKKRLRRIHDGLKSEKYSDILAGIKAISALISKNIYRPFIKEQEFINKKLEEVQLKAENELEDVTPWLDIFIFIKRYNFANVRNEIFGYIYENYLKDLFGEEKKGQYFTDPDVVNFMLKEIGYVPSEIHKRFKKNNDSISLIDPACGSGTFLYSAVVNIMEGIPNGSEQTSRIVENIVNSNIFGLDIEEFPLYLAEMSIIMRMLPLIINEKYNNPIDKKIKVFKTNDSISEFMDTALRNTMSDVTIEEGRGNSQADMFATELNLGYPSYVRDEDDLRAMKQSLENQQHISRYRFDFVIGNPPYISYNECASQNLLFFEYIRKGKAKLNNVYGVNLHSVPQNRKKYPPKPNLYAFFIAIGLALLKDNGRLCYIIPQTLLTESDYDVLRYHLSKYTTIEKIITFGNPLFLGRGLKQKTKVATSSLIFVANRKMPEPGHVVTIINYEKSDEEITTTLKNIKSRKDTTISEIEQSLLLKNYLNWNFIKQSKDFINIYDEYKSRNDSLAAYYEHTLSKHKFGDIFYFDVGFILDRERFIDTPKSSRDYELIEFKNFQGYSVYHPKIFYPNDISYIKLPKNSQGHGSLNKRYKIVWSKTYTDKFHFTDQNILPNMSNQQFISSDNREEMLYLFAILNSPITNTVMQMLFNVSNEKIGMFMVIKRIKGFLRIPKITLHNAYLKTEIIETVEEMLKLESYELRHLIDFSDIMVQTCDDLYIEKGNLVMVKHDGQIKCKITSKPALVKQAIDEIKENKLFLSDNGKIQVYRIKAYRVIDHDLQSALKQYIDDLVFALYFGVDLGKATLKKADEIHAICRRNKFYKTINASYSTG